MDAFATKEDIANAKISMILVWVSGIFIVITGVISALIRFWPS